MKPKTTTQTRVSTWLPVFPGFYGTIFEPQEDREIESINDEREKRGLPEAKFDEFEFDYEDFRQTTAKQCTGIIERALGRFVKSIEFEALHSPREYNFANDSINCVVTLSKVNKGAILRYLEINAEAFARYLKDTYTSCSGFISSYPNNVQYFMEDKPLEHKHKLGSILQFICQNEDINQETLYYGLEVYLSVTNYDELLPE